MVMVLPFYSILFFFLSPTVVAILQNVTVNSAALGIDYRPQRAWTVSTDSQATGGSFTQSGAENATVVFNITSPSTALFWHGFLPRTAARYSICIDCSNPEALGSIVTIQTGSKTREPVILFASKPLDNTTHSIVVRNLRNPIEGVVGVISLDSFSFTTDVEAPTANPITAPTTSSANPSIGGIVGIVIASVVAAGILLALAKFCTRRRRQGGSNCSTKRSKIWRKSFLSPRIPWKRHQRTASSESSPIIEAVWKSKPLTVPDELPIHNGQTHRSNHTDATQRSNGGQRKSGVPVITITSPSTISTNASLYSTTHQDGPAPSLFKLSIYETDKGVRQSDPYASYAAAYASFAGVTNYDNDDGQSSDQQNGNRQQQSALRDSSLLPLQERNPQSGTGPLKPTPPYGSASQNHLPPSSFKGQGIRDGKKGTRTLSDKIKRGTLPVPPELEEGTLRVSVDLIVPDAESAEVQGPARGKEYRIEGDLTITAKSKETPENKDDRPSLLPTFSSDSSTPSGPADKPNTLYSLASETASQTLQPAVAANPSLPDIITADPAFWSNYGDFSILETTEDFEQVAESSSDGVESTLEESERIQSRPQSLQARSSPSPTNLVHRSSKSEGGSNKGKPNPKPFASYLSIMTADTSNTHTTRSSLFSITPSVSDFPMPPFKQMNSARNSSRKSARLSSTPSDSNNSASFTDLLASTPSSSSAASGSGSTSTVGSKPRSNFMRERVPPSAFTAAARPRRARAPSFKVSRDGASGSGLSVPLLAQTRVPIRRGSSRSSKGSKRRSQSPGARMLQLPIRGNALAPPLPNGKIVQRRIAEISQPQNVEAQDNTSRQSTRSDATGETAGSDVPFYMRMLAGSPEGDSENGKQQRNASRLTMASMLTTTDEEFAGDVQLVIASRISNIPNLPKPAMVAHPTALNSAVSLRSDVLGSTGSSNGQWEMVATNDRVQPAGMPTGLSISTDRNRHRAINVPVSARTEMFDAGVSEISHMGGASTEPVIGFGSGMGMPWSPNFDWPASPALNLASPMPTTAPVPSAVLSSKEQPTFRSATSRTYDYPTSVSGSVEAWNSGRIESVSPDSRPISQGTLASGDTPGWKDLLGGPVFGSQRKSGPNTRDSTYSTASSSFFGAGSSAQSPVIIPPVPPMPPPVPAASPNGHKPVSPINTRQGWHARTSSSLSPVEKQRYSRQRQTGNIAVGGVNSVFATPQSAATRPKLSLQRVEASVEAPGNGTPISRYNSPYTGYLSPPSSAEPLISKR